MYSENLFSYGTLQLEAVQLATFGRKMEGAADTLTHYALGKQQITDPHVLATSAQDFHLTLDYSGNTQDIVHGVVLQVSTAELIQADIYEEECYQRIQVQLVSGTDAWVYVRR